MAKLHPISSICQDPDRKDGRRADVVFIHGLGGDHFLTWRHGDDDSSSWPHWLAEEFPDVGVWSLGYAASPSKWFRLLKKLPFAWVPGLKGFYRHADRDTGHSLSLPDRAAQVLNGMRLDDIGSRPLIFVCHSLGGLLAKQILRASADSADPRWQVVRRNTAAVMFLATPHAGSDLASRINLIGKLLRANPSLYGLNANDPHLRELGQWYADNMRTPETVVYCEGRDTSGLRVVDETSAQWIIGRRPIVLDEDHLSISKPRERDADVCKDLRQIVTKLPRMGVPAVEVAAQPMANMSVSPAAPAPAEPLRLTPGGFIGRDDELDDLRKALLPDGTAARKPTVVCCAIEGMPGVGKTRLAEEFVQRHWLPALALPADADPASHVLRVALAHEDRRSALDLGNALADLLRSPGPGDSLWQRLRPQLLEGPYRKPRLVLIENVDDAPQAQAVAELVGHLPGCAILVTARHRKLGGAGWARVGVAPLPLDKAAELLRSEADTGEGAYVPDQAQAEALAETLGRLPLALHIAASHLGLGHTPASFLDALRDEGLDLAPANPGDHGLNVDRARAILRSSFDLSWKAWCMGAGADPEWPQALVALAHGPAVGVGDSLGVAITALDEKQYVACVIAAKRLSLLEFQFEGEGAARQRRTSLHPLIAEFLRSQPAPDAQTVIARMGAWFGPRLSDQDHDTMGVSRRQVQGEPVALTQWLAAATLEDGAGLVVAGTQYAIACGPYSAWLACFERWSSASTNEATRAQLAWAIAHIAQSSGQIETALQSAQTAADLFRGQGMDREAAITQGQIADILQARGQLDEALRIRREEQMPVYERLGDVRSLAITQGQIADILQARGQLDEALRIRREEQMPVYERLGDVRELLVSRTNLAITLAQRGRVEDAEEIHTLLHQALAAAEDMQLPEAETIRGLIAQIFGPNDHDAPASL